MSIQKESVYNLICQLVSEKALDHGVAIENMVIGVNTIREGVEFGPNGLLLKVQFIMAYEDQLEEVLEEWIVNPKGNVITR